MTHQPCWIARRPARIRFGSSWRAGTAKIGARYGETGHVGPRTVQTCGSRGKKALHERVQPLVAAGGHIDIAPVSATEAEACHVPARQRYPTIERAVRQHADNGARREAGDPYAAFAIAGQAVAILLRGQRSAIGEGSVGRQIVSEGAKPAFVEIETSPVGAQSDAVGDLQSIPEKRDSSVRV